MSRSHRVTEFFSYDLWHCPFELIRNEIHYSVALIAIPDQDLKYLYF